ncbi:MAG: PAS domain-containing sensor histidine kinase [bacterium]
MDRQRRRFSDKIFNAIPGYLTVQDRDFRIIEANDSFRRNFGDYNDRYCYQVYKQRPERCEDCPVARTFSDGQKHRSEELVTTLGGKQVSVLVYTTPILDDNGEVSEVIEMSTDITLLKDLQMDIRTSRRKYRQLFEEVPCFISIQDQDLNITDANRLHRETFGTGYGRKCFEIYKHRDKECLPCTVRQTFTDGKPRNHEEVVSSQSGELMNVLVHTAPLHNGEGVIEGVIEMSTNITMIRQLQDKLASVGMLIGTVSHGIKGLLNSLDGGIYLINSGIKKNDTARVDKGWDMALRNIRRIRSMVMDILYYAKDRDPNWEQISAGEILEDVCKTMTDRARKVEVEVECTVTGTGEYEGDRQMIRSMLVNFIENAIDACRIDKSKPHHLVKLELHDLDDGIQFIISDNGIGMDRETREKAFSLFFSSKGAGGTGLGLFIAHKIVMSHGGNIRIESEPGEGSRFFVELPRKRPEPSTETDSESTETEEI